MDFGVIISKGCCSPVHCCVLSNTDCELFFFASAFASASFFFCCWRRFRSSGEDMSAAETRSRVRAVAESGAWLLAKGIAIRRDNGRFADGGRLW